MDFGTQLGCYCVRQALVLVLVLVLVLALVLVLVAPVTVHALRRSRFLVPPCSNLNDVLVH